MIITPNKYSRFTIIVCGTEFSGTSLVAGTLRILGIPMGSTFYPEDSHQDIEFCSPYCDDNMLRAIHTRNTLFKVWGFKYVGLSMYIDKAIKHFTNPVFIYCHRSLLSTLETQSKYRSSDEELIFNHIKESNQLMKTIHQVKPPWMVIEHAMDANQILTELIEFTHLIPPQKVRNTALAFNNRAASYTPLTTPKYF